MNTSYLFVTVGSTDFDALVQSVDTLIPVYQDFQGIMQIGHGRYTPENMPYFRFAPSLNPFYDKASLVIAHGGLGTTMEVLRRGLPLVSVSNPDRFDNHQDDILQAMAEAGYLHWCRSLDHLDQAIAEALSSPLKRYQSQECSIPSVIEQYLLTL